MSLTINSLLAALHVISGSVSLSFTLLVGGVVVLLGNMSHVGGEVAPGSCLSVRAISSVNVGAPNACLSLTPLQVGDDVVLPGNISQDGDEAALVSRLSVSTTPLGGEAALHGGGASCLPVSDFSSGMAPAPAESKTFL